MDRRTAWARGLRVGLGLTVACAGEAREDVYLSQVTVEPEGAACAQGGHRFLAGVDADHDGLLEPDEVRTSSVACHAEEEPSGAGSGVGAPAVDCQISTTTVSPEVAWRRELDVLGRGFLSLRGSASNQDVTFYARGATVHRDAEGCLVDGFGLRLLGFALDGRGERVEREATDVCVRPEDLLGVATRFVALEVNLDARSTRPLLPFDPSALDLSRNAWFDLTVFDSRGVGHLLTVSVNLTEERVWEWHAHVDGGEVSSGSAGVPYELARGYLVFDAYGRLRSDDLEFSSVDFVGATPNQIIGFDFGSSIEEGGSPGEGSTSSVAPTALKRAWRDGYGRGALSDLRIGDDGMVRGRYTNGEDFPFAQLALATFPSSYALSPVCVGLWAASADSGSASLEVSGVDGRGALAVSAPE